MDNDILLSLAKYNDIIDRMTIIIDIAVKAGGKNFFTLINLTPYQLFLKHLYIERG